MDRGYLLLDVKSIDPMARRIAGIASTPELDRQGDILDPAGVTFRNPVPLLLAHNQKEPIGTAILTATRDGITFDAVLPTVDEAGPLKTRTDDVWQMLKAGVLSGASIGFSILDNAVEHIRPGVRKLLKTEICELSLVTIPANRAATITLVKSLSQRPTMNLTTAEHVTNLDTKRAATVARLDAILDAAKDGDRTLTPEERTTVDGLTLEAKTLASDADLYRQREQIQIARAVPVAPRASFLSITDNTEPGILMARYVIAKMASKLDNVDAATYAERRWGTSSPVTLELKAAVAAGDTQNATWAKPLVNPVISAGLIELLRAATLLGKIPGLNRVPFNVSIPSQTAGATVNWVGELKPKPVSAMAFATETLGFSKVAVIVPLSQELIRFSNPSAEAVVKNSLVKDIAAFLDVQFTNPAVAAVTGLNPASITNGAATAAATASPLADMIGLINHFVTNNIPIDGLVFLMSPQNALALSFRTNTDGSPQFPGVGINGGSWKGMTILVSSAVSTNVIAFQPNSILYADDGGVTIDTSTEASLQMDSAPDSPVVATTVYVSMFQMNAVAVRAERFVNWKRIGGANTVKYLTAAAWAAPTGLVLQGQNAIDDDAPASKRK